MFQGLVVWRNHRIWKSGSFVRFCPWGPSALSVSIDGGDCQGHIRHVTLIDMRGPVLKNIVQCQLNRYASASVKWQNLQTFIDSLNSLSHDKICKIYLQSGSQHAVSLSFYLNF